MKKLILLIACFYSFTISAQEKAVQNKWAIKVMGSVDYAYRNLSVNHSKEYIETTPDGTNHNISQLIVDYLNKHQKPICAYTTEIAASYKICPKITLELGITFAKRGKKAVYDFLLSPHSSLFTSSTNPYFIPYADDKEIDYINYYYVDISPKINFYIIKHKSLSFYATAGILPSFLVKSKIRYVLYHGGNKKVENSNDPYYGDLNTFSLGALAGIGIEWAINNHYHLFFQPTVRYFSLPIGEFYGVEERLYSGGAVLGLSYNF